MKHSLNTFLRLYSFLTQIMPFYDMSLEKLYTYCRFLMKKLPKDRDDPFQLGDDVSLEYYRLQKMSETNLVLESGEEGQIPGILYAGGGKVPDEKAHLSEIIEVLNERFGTEFKEADRLFFDQIEQEMVGNSKLAEQARSNTLENFRFGFDEQFMASLISRMDQNQEIFAKIMDDAEFGRVVKTLMLQRVYERLKVAL